MELQIIGFIMTVGLLVHAIYLRICYFKHDAVCLDWNPGGKSFLVRIHYEYELKQGQRMVTCETWGWTYFWARKGKRYKVLICKKDYYKVSGYRVFVVHLLVGGFFLASSIALAILR